jgi:arginyl-tRNA synthetase
MKQYEDALRREVHAALAALGWLDPQTTAPEKTVIETPPRPEMGDRAVPMFPYAKQARQAPARIAAAVAEELRRRGAEERARIRLEAQGPYLNVRFDRPAVTADVLERIRRDPAGYGRGAALQGQRIMVEFSSPNTNKPLHLGHLRNDSLGMSVTRLLAAGGAEVLKTNLINDRGIHICKSMLAYRKFGGGRTPGEEGQKSDHLVGKYYVRFAEWAKEDPTAEEQARRMLKAWEDGDPEVRALWATMNGWAIAGIEETYRATGVSFDRVYLESRMYESGREEVLRGLEQGLFYREADGSVWVDLSAEGLDKKVLLRADGTSIYLTQDIATAIQRRGDWPFDRLIYVVANEQRYHFQVLFRVLDMLGHPWAPSLHHLAYGMVNLPEGKMKSREGTVVDADDLLADLRELAVSEIRERERETEVDDLEETARRIALGALNYYLLKVSPLKDFVFNPAESISFTGETGPYLQYTGARIASMLRKFEERRGRFASGVFRPELLEAAEEWELVKLLGGWPEAVRLAAADLNPAMICAHLFELARTYSRYYHDQPVLHNESRDLVVSRIELARAILSVLQNGFLLLGIPYLARM